MRRIGKKRILIAVSLLFIIGSSGCQQQQNELEKIISDTTQGVSEIIKKIENPQVDESVVSGNYHYGQLAEEEKKIYRELYEGISQMTKNIPISTADTDQASRLIEFVLMDSPELFWTDGGGELSGYGSALFFTPSYHVSPEEKAVRQAQIDEAVSQCLAGLDMGLDDYGKIKYLFDYIVNTTEYDLQAADSQNMYSAIVNKRSVCAGYSKAMQYMLRQLGIECIYVTGTTMEQEAHAWNIVQCAGQYYELDVTWGDPVFLEGNGEQMPPELTINYDYLCCSDAEIFRTHTLDQLVVYPACVSMDYNYYRMNGMYYEQYDEQALLQAMNHSIAEGQPYTILKFGSSEVYAQAVDPVINDLVQRAAETLGEMYGLYEVSYSYMTDENLNKITLLWNYS